MIQSAQLSELGGIRHAFFSRAGGVSQGIYASLNSGIASADSSKNVAENRARMAAALGVAHDHLLTAYQIHSPQVVVAETPWTASDRPRADAIVTRVPNLAVGVSTADCGPVLLADTKARVVGAAHAGWRGALAGVVEATISAMEKLGADRAHMVAALGPMIRQKSYEVGPEVRAQFVAADSGNARFFTPTQREGHTLFDLAGFIVAGLRQANIGAIEDIGLCTYEDAARFYSYRRSVHRAEPDYGRHINAIVLADTRP